MSGLRGYDDWKLRSDRDEYPEQVFRCDDCGHPDNYCDCRCCHEPEHECMDIGPGRNCATCGETLR